MTTPVLPSSLSPAWRRAALIITPIGPLAVAALRWLLPYDTTDDPTTLVAKVASHPGAESAVLWLSLLALLALPLGILVVGAIAVRARPVLGTIAAVLAWCSFATLPFLITPDQIALGGVEAGLPTATTAALMTAAAVHPVSTAATVLWVAGHILGLVLLGVALWRAIPTWAAVALIVSQPLHFVFAVIAPNHLLDGLAWLLTAVGFAVAAAAGLGSGRTAPASTRSTAGAVG